jgi:hypothetical protein
VPWRIWSQGSQGPTGPRKSSILALSTKIISSPEIPRYNKSH